MENAQSRSTADKGLAPSGPRGHYLGTEIDGCWWRRYRKDGFFARGAGEYWVEGGALCFRRYLTKRPLVIPLGALVAIEQGTWHAGKWAGGAPVVKLVWSRDGRRLSSGFVVSRDIDVAQRWIHMLREATGTVA